MSNAEHDRGPTFSEMITLKVAACTAGLKIPDLQAFVDSTSSWL